MNREEIEQNVDKIVLYRDRLYQAARPARLLDHHQWVSHNEPHLRVRRVGAVEVSTNDMQIGYPILTSRFLVPNQESRDQVLNFLAEVFNMDSLFNEEGFSKGILDRKGILGERVIFRLVSENELEDGFAELIEAEKAKEAERLAGKAAAEEQMNRAADEAEFISEVLLASNFMAGKNQPLVRVDSVDSSRFSVDAEVLSYLYKICSHLLNACEHCGIFDYLVPFNSPFCTHEMLCASCHPSMRE